MRSHILLKAFQGASALFLGLLVCFKAPYYTRSDSPPVAARVFRSWADHGFLLYLDARVWTIYISVRIFNCQKVSLFLHFLSSFDFYSQLPTARSRELFLGIVPPIRTPHVQPRRIQTAALFFSTSQFPSLLDLSLSLFPFYIVAQLCRRFLQR